MNLDVVSLCKRVLAAHAMKRNTLRDVEGNVGPLCSSALTGCLGQIDRLRSAG